MRQKCWPLCLVEEVNRNALQPVSQYGIQGILISGYNSDICGQIVTESRAYVFLGNPRLSCSRLRWRIIFSHYGWWSLGTRPTKVKFFNLWYEDFYYKITPSLSDVKRSNKTILNLQHRLVLHPNNYHELNKELIKCTQLSYFPGCLID